MTCMSRYVYGSKSLYSVLLGTWPCTTNNLTNILKGAEESELIHTEILQDHRASNCERHL